MSQDIEGRRRKMQIEAVFFPEFLEKIRGKLGDIARPLPKRRQDERDDADAVIEVGPEFFLFDELLQIPVGGADQAEIHFQFS